MAGIGLDGGDLAVAGDPGVLGRHGNGVHGGPLLNGDVGGLGHEYPVYLTVDGEVRLNRDRPQIAGRGVQTGGAIGVCHHGAAAGGGAGELDALSAAADDDPSRYTDVVQGDVGRAIGQDQVPVNRQVVQGDGVPPDNHIARHHPGRGAALVHIGAGQIADDLGKLRPGDLGLGVELAIGAGDVAVLHQGGHRVCGPGGDLSLVREGVQRVGVLRLQHKGPGQHGEGLLPGDGLIGPQGAVVPLEGPHLHGLGQLFIVPVCGCHILITGQGGRGCGAESPVDHGGHLGPGQQAGGIDFSIVTVQQSIFHGLAQGRGRPVRRKIRKVVCCGSHSRG